MSLKQIRGVLAQLKPGEIRERAERPVWILLRTASPAAAAAMERFLLPVGLTAERRADSATMLAREASAVQGGRFHLVFYETGVQPPEGWHPGHNAFEFDPRHPEALVAEVAGARDDLALALARRFPPFRQTVTRGVIHRVANENALVAIMSALPNVIPSLAEIPWAFGEFATDTTVLTANQIRMALLLAGASDRPVGYAEQRNEIGSIVAGAFGWRSLAREFTGKIPFGGGLIPKAAIAYAGTWTAGVSLERFYRIGYHMTRKERKAAWDEAFTKGREIASQLVARVRWPEKGGQLAGGPELKEPVS
jgi:hypothetical protein